MINDRMSNMKGVIVTMVVLAAILVINLAPTSQQGDVNSKFAKVLDSETLNGTNTITGTPFRVSDAMGFISMFYDVDVGTSTAHYQIKAYTSPDNSTYATDGILLSPSSDETSVDVKHVSVPITLCNWVRIDIEGVTSNATNTTISAWECYQ